MAITSANQLELLQTAEAVAREKMIDPALVVEAMEESLARAAKSRYGAEMDIRVSIDRKTGRASFTRVRTVVDPEELENEKAELTPDQAKVYFKPPMAGRDEYWLREGQRIEPEGIVLQSGRRVEVDTSGRGLKAQLKGANTRGARVVIIAGDDERAADVFQMKTMDTGHQEEVASGELLARVREVLDT